MLEDPKNLARVLGPRVGVKALIHRDGALLFNHSRAQREDGTVEEWYDLPGGGQEYGESQADALRRECVEEIGARVRVYQIATVFEFATGAQGASPEGLTADDPEFFHQLNVGYWCDLEPGSEPGSLHADGMDTHQVGTAWLPIDEIDRYRVSPPALAEWLQSDPSSRPVGLGFVTT